MREKRREDFLKRYFRSVKRGLGTRGWHFFSQEQELKADSRKESRDESLTPPGP